MQERERNAASLRRASNAPIHNQDRFVSHPVGEHLLASNSVEEGRNWILDQQLVEVERL
ncbi:MAG: hypothetical protein AAF823_04860 [Planctomycetota bacterium]